MRCNYKAITEPGAETFWRVWVATETESMMKWLIYQGILHLQTATGKHQQQQCGSDVVGLDWRETWAVTCSVCGHWRTDDERAVILQSLSQFSEAVDLRRHAETNQVPLTAVAETWLKPRWPRPKPGRQLFYKQFRCRSRNSVGLHR